VIEGGFEVEEDLDENEESKEWLISLHHFVTESEKVRKTII